MDKYHNWIEYRTENEKKFKKMYMKLFTDCLKLYNHENDSKEKITILFKNAVFHKEITNQNRFPPEKLKTSFEITLEKNHQFICETHEEFIDWVNRIPLYCDFSGVFGFPLQSVCDKKKSGWRFPIPLYRSIEYLRNKKGNQIEGIFRTSANHIWMNRVKHLLNSGQDIKDEEFGNEGCIVAACMVKLCIRELSDGLIPNRLYYDFVHAGTETDNEERVKMIKKLVDSMPDINKNTLWYICNYLVEVIAMEDVNHMSSSNLAVCFGPCLFVRTNIDVSVEMENAEKIRIVFSTFLDNFFEIFDDLTTENKKIGIYAPRYPAVNPTAAVSDAVVAQQVASEVVRRKTISQQQKQPPTRSVDDSVVEKRETEVPRDMFKPQHRKAGRPISLFCNRTQLTSTDSNSITKSNPFEAPKRNASNFLNSNEPLVVQHMNSQSTNKNETKTETKTEFQARTPNVSQTNMSNKMIEDKFNILIKKIEQQDQIIEQLMKRVSYLENELKIKNNEPQIETMSIDEMKSQMNQPKQNSFLKMREKKVDDKHEEKKEEKVEKTEKVEEQKEIHETKEEFVGDETSKGEISPIKNSFFQKNQNSRPSTQPNQPRANFIGGRGLKPQGQ